MLKKAINWAWISSLTLVGFLYVSAKPALAIPPQYFQSTPIITSGLAGPSSFEFSPDGRIFILQRTGEVKIFKNGSLLPQNFVTLPSANTGDRGLIGIAFDPDFDTNHYVYFYYTSASDLRNYLVRFSAEGDVATNGPVEIYKTPDQSFELHVGGGITFGVDGKLYLGIGDNGYGPNGQDLSSSHGKILRLNKDGSAPSDNPFFNTPGALPEIYTLGHRNPWRLTIDKVTNRMYVADVGANDWEEINQVVKGKNYGWSICEGYCNTPPYVDPIYSYSHNGQSSAVALGLVYRGNMFPSTYYGQLFFGDYAKYFLKSLTLDSLGKVVSVNDFDSSIGTVVDIKEHPIDGSLYYITYYPGRLYRLSYSTSNQIPTASAGASVTKGVPPLTVQFTSSGSTDPDNQPLSYMWDFGDGNTSTLPNPVHTYSYNGAFTVELTVSDGTNTARAVPVVIQVGLAPIVNIGTPLDGSQYKAGDMINYSAHAVDGTGNDINDTSISTEILFHHHTHIHPFYGPVVGRAGSVKIPDINAESDTDQWFEIRVTATDYNGLSTTKSVNIYPQTSSTLIQSNPPGLSLSLDGQPIASPKTVNRLVGYQSEVSAPETQILNNKIYHFYGWSDGGQRTHYFTQTTEPKSITALYFSPSDSAPFSAQYFPNKTLSGNPSLVRTDSQINFDWGLSSPDASLSADSFSVRWTSAQNFPPGLFRFTATGDDGIRLYVDGNLVIDQWRDQGPTPHSADVLITEGEHTVVYEYYESGGSAIAKLKWEPSPVQPTPTSTPTPTPPISTPTISPTPTPTPGSQSGFMASYYPNKLLSGTPVFTSVDPIINFDWGDNAPNVFTPKDDFSVRWIKNQTFDTDGTYRFTSASDDGIRLFVDGILVLNKWVEQSVTSHYVDIQLTKGDHQIVYEYFDACCSAVAKLSWSNISPQPSVSPTPTLTPTPTPTVVNTPTPTVTPTTTPSSNFTAMYYSNKQLTGSPVYTTSDPIINFDWGDNAPNVFTPKDDFSVKWTKSQMFDVSGIYRFTSASDDGVRLIIDNKLVIDKWVEQSSTTYSADIELHSGVHQIVYEYFDACCSAVAKLSWSLVAPVTPTPTPTVVNTPTPTLTPTPTMSPSTPTPTPVTVQETEFSGEYYANKILSGAPVHTSTDPIINFDWGDNAPNVFTPKDDFSVRWTANKNFPTSGVYKFTSSSDDGVRLYINGNLIIDKWIEQSQTTYAAYVNISAGLHVIKYEYFDACCSAVAKLSWSLDSSIAPTPASTPTPTQGPTPTIQPTPTPTSTPSTINQFQAEFFNGKGFDSQPMETMTVPLINYYWGPSESPKNITSPDNFSSRFTGTLAISPGTYRFTVTGDDGVRLYINNAVVLDHWIDQSPTTYTADVNLSTDTINIKLEHYESGGEAVAKLVWTKL